MNSNSKKLSKSEAGALGGQATLRKHGREHFQWIAPMGARAMHDKYQLVPLGQSDFALVNRATGEPTGKTIRGLSL